MKGQENVHQIIISNSISLLNFSENNSINIASEYNNRQYIGLKKSPMKLKFHLLDINIIETD